MLLYADEDFPQPVVDELRRLGHDVLTARDDGRLATPDPDILARAHSLGRAVLTHNRRHYERLHRRGPTTAASCRRPRIRRTNRPWPPASLSS
jgi:hypothetical protein